MYRCASYCLFCVLREGGGQCSCAQHSALREAKSNLSLTGDSNSSCPMFPNVSPLLPLSGLLLNLCHPPYIYLLYFKLTHFLKQKYPKTKNLLYDFWMESNLYSANKRVLCSSYNFLSSKALKETSPFGKMTKVRKMLQLSLSHCNQRIDSKFKGNN